MRKTFHAKPQRREVRKTGTTGALFFDEIKRDPGDGLKLQFPAVHQFDAQERLIANELPQGPIFQYRTKYWLTA